MNYQKTRCKLNVNFGGGLELIIPLNQLCEEAVVFTTTQFKIENSFARCSTIDAFVEHGIYHCGDGMILNIFEKFLLFLTQFFKQL